METTRLDGLQQFNGKALHLPWERPTASIPLHLVLIILIGAIAVAARLHGLADRPLWYDEVLTLWRANLSLNELIVDATNNKHFPLYFWAVKPFAAAPWTEWFLRLPSVVLGAACAILTASIAMRLGGNFAGFVAGVLMALSPLEVQYGQEARSYALTSAAVLLSLCGLVRLVDQFGPAAETGRQTSTETAGPWVTVGPWVAYAVGMNVALNTLGVAAPWFFAANITVFAIHWAQRLPTAPIRAWVWVNLATAVLWLPGIVMIMTANYDHPLRGHQWTPAVSLELAGQVLAALYMFRISDHMTFELMPAAVSILGPALIALALAGTWQLRQDPGRAAVLLAATFTMPVTVALISVFHPMILPRYLLWSTGPYFILVGLGVAMLPKLVRSPMTIALALAALVSLLPYYETETKPRWDKVAAHLQENVQSRDGLITSGGLSRVVLEAYMTRDGRPPPAILQFEDADEIKRRYDAGHTIWIIYGRTGQGSREPEGEFFARWAMFGTPTEQRAFGKNILLARYDKQTASR